MLKGSLPDQGPGKHPWLSHPAAAATRTSVQRRGAARRTGLISINAMHWPLAANSHACSLLQSHACAAYRHHVKRKRKKERHHKERKRAKTDAEKVSTASHSSMQCGTSCVGILLAGADAVALDPLYQVEELERHAAAQGDLPRRPQPQQWAGTASGQPEQPYYIDAQVSTADVKVGWQSTSIKLEPAL